MPIVFVFYLLALAPTILWRDTPEFANVGFTLSIAHPAGFPSYSLLVKALTFIPIGSITFKTNLASAVFSVLTVILISAALKLLLRRVYPDASGADIQVSSTLATLLFAVGPIVWHNATVAEVYTLNTLFIAALIYVIVRWLEGFDPHWLYLGSFLYGLSAGNHATVAFFLPGLLAFYFFNRPERNSSEWLRVSFFFLLGLSVYLYLPVRSLANPAFDWGDPQNLKNFLYQITDQKDFGAGGALSESDGSTSFYLIFNHLSLLAAQFSPVGIALILLGFIPAVRHERGLSLLLLWVLFSNHAFFWGWTSGDGSLPSYLALTFFLSVGTCTLLGTACRWSRVTASRVRKLIEVGLISLIAIHVLFTYPKVNKRDYYLPFGFYRTAFSSLEPEAVLFTYLQWFHLKYFQDIERLREEITVVSTEEVLNPRDLNPLTSNRHPRLFFPAHTVADSGQSFLFELLARNVHEGRPIYWDLPHDFFAFVDRNLLPERDLLFRFSIDPVKELKPGQLDTYFEKLWDEMLGAIQAGRNFGDRDLQVYFSEYLRFLLRYLRMHHQPVKETPALMRLSLFLHGPQGNNTLDSQQLSNLYNSIGLSDLRRSETFNGLKSLDLAIQYDPKNKDPYLNLALWSVEKAPDRFGEILGRARANGVNPKVICATLTDYLLKEGQTSLHKKAQSLCK